MTPKIIFSHKSNNKTYNYYSTQIMGSEKVKVNGKHYFLLVNSNKTVNRWESTNIDSNISTKQCKNCGCKKSTNSFYINSSSIDGFSNNCRDCDYNYNQIKRKQYHLVNQSK